MKKHEILAVLLIVVGAIVMAFFTINSLPKRLDPPRRWVSEATSTGIVSRANAKGIEVRFPNGKKMDFRETGYGETRFTNGQPVLVEVQVHYVNYYDVPPSSPGLAELVFRSVYPNP